MKTITALLKNLIRTVIEIDITRNLETDYQYKIDALETLWAAFSLLDDNIKPDSVTAIAIGFIEDALSNLECITYYDHQEEASTMDIIHSAAIELIGSLREEENSTNNLLK